MANDIETQQFEIRQRCIAAKKLIFFFFAPMTRNFETNQGSNKVLIKIFNQFLKK